MKGPLPAAAVFFVLLCAGSIWTLPPGWNWMASERLIAGWCDALLNSLDAGTAALVRLVLVSGLGGALFGLVHRYTSNTIVSFGTAGLFVLHPGIVAHLAQPGGAGEVLAAALVLEALRLSRERALGAAEGRAIRGVSTRMGILGILAGLAGPAALAAPGLALISESMAVPIAGARRRALHGALPLIPGALIAALDARMPSAWSVEGLSTAAAFPLRWIGLHAAGGLLVLASVASVAALVVGWIWCRRGLRQGAERHTIHHLTLSVGTPFLAGFPVALAHGGPTLLMTAFAALLPLSLIWRALLQLAPAPLPKPDEAPFDIGPFLHPEPEPPSQPVAQEAPRAPADDAQREEVRRVVYDSLAEAFGGAAQRVRPGADPSDSERRQRQALERARTKALRALPDAWRDRDLERRLYRSHLRPWISRDHRVLELAPPDGLLSQQLLADGAELLRVDPAPRALSDLDDALRERVLDLKVALPDLGAVASESVDLVYSHECLLRSSMAEALTLLAEVQRVLRPGGRAFLFFVALDSPRALERLEAASRRIIDAEEPDLLFMTNDSIRLLCERAGLGIDLVHVGATDRDSLVVAEKTPGLTGLN